MQTFKARLAGLLAHMGEQVGVFAREEFSRAVAHAIMPREATHNPALSILMVVNDNLDPGDDSPLNLTMRDFVAQTLSAILSGNLDESEEPGMAKAHRELFDVIEGFVEDEQIRAIVREEIARATLTAGGK